MSLWDPPRFRSALTEPGLCQGLLEGMAPLCLPPQGLPKGRAPSSVCPSENPYRGRLQDRWSRHRMLCREGCGLAGESEQALCVSLARSWVDS